jgi:hypothetical protein
VVGPHGSIRTHEPASPRLSEAHIPASAVPRVSASADPRSMAFATRSSLAAARRGYAAPASRGSTSAAQRADGWRSSYVRPSREQGAVLRTPTTRVQAERGASPSYPSVYSSSRSSAPAYSSRPSYGGQGALRPQVSTQSHQAAAPEYHPAHASGGHFGGGHRR